MHHPAEYLRHFANSYILSTLHSRLFTINNCLNTCWDHTGPSRWGLFGHLSIAFRPLLLISVYLCVHFVSWHEEVQRHAGR